MNNSNTPKVVVGVGLVAIYAVGLTVLTLRGKHGEILRSPPAAVAAPMTADVAVPDAAITEPAQPAEPLVSPGTVGAEGNAPASTPAPVARRGGSAVDEAVRPPPAGGNEEASREDTPVSEATTEPAASTEVADTPTPASDSRDDAGSDEPALLITD